ncbi:putative Serpin family protein [Medicago truncatula]|uniref:Putative Serpin family protein n=1 Tax=Medicago truncatula TaxID=3880 RepID=A0A396JB34_MEDTR|nr:serpin-ZX [Medicago truncatula]RHN73811.1 putative Serpin family protein [Medicago truncatula]
MALQESITNQTKVSLDIARHLLLKQSDKNIVFSPLSLQIVLSLIAAGSEDPTQQQLVDFLRFKSTNHLNSFTSYLHSVLLKDFAHGRLSFVDGVWVEQTLSLQPSFKQIVRDNYKATPASLDFLTKVVEVTKKVNLWSEKETIGLIKELLPRGPVDRSASVIFANALYFIGAWNEKFDLSKTENSDFHLLNGNSVKVPFMVSKKMQFIEAYDGSKVLRLPYKKGQDTRQFSMYIFLPNAKDGLPALVEKMTSKYELLQENLSLYDQLKQVKVGEFKIPRFNVSFGLETSDTLKELGVVLPFFPGGLTKMVDSLAGQSLSVSHIFHKSFIRVNEEGTEVAAASAARLSKGCSFSPPLNFEVNHPFLFLIREDLTGAILFVGQVLNPLDE